MSTTRRLTLEEQTIKQNEKMRTEAREAFNSLRLDSRSVSSPDSERTPIEEVESFLSSSDTKESTLVTSSNSPIDNSSSFSSTATTTNTDEDDVYSLDPSSYRNNSYRSNRSYRFAPRNRKKSIPSSSSIVSFSSTRSILSTSALLGMHKQVKKSSKKVYESIKYQYKLPSVIKKSQRSLCSTKETVNDDLLSATEWSQVTVSPDISMKKVSFSLPSDSPSRLSKTKKLYRKSVKKLKKISSNKLSHDCRVDTEIRAIRDDSSIASKNVVRSVSVLASGTIPMDYSCRENMRINYKHALIYIILYVSILILSNEWGRTSSTMLNNELRLNPLNHVENIKVQGIEFKQEVGEINDKYEDHCEEEFIQYLFKDDITSIADNGTELTSMSEDTENYSEETSSQVIIHDISSQHTDTTLPVIKTQKYEDSFISNAIHKMFHHAIEGSKHKQTDDKLFEFIVGVL